VGIPAGAPEGHLMETEDFVEGAKACLPGKIKNK
jgi:hypothetical protein